MLNGTHEQIDHQFTLDGTVFNKLYYLVDGIYPSLSRFVGPENDPTTHLDGCFKVDQEAACKDVERGYGVLKLKFLVLAHPINLHPRDGIYYLVMATIVLHNMMVEERLTDDEVEDGLFYNSFCSENEHDDGEDIECYDDAYSSTPAGRLDKFNMVHRRWEELYDCDGSKNLKDQ